MFKQPHIVASSLPAGFKRVGIVHLLTYILLVLIGLYSAKAQGQVLAQPGLYRQTVENFNITTIRFVLEHDTSITTRTRALSLAQSMESSEFPYDEMVLRIRMLYGDNSRTEALFRRLDSRRNMYQEDRGLDEQLRDVINFIVTDQAIRNKPYQQELKMRLDEIRAQATVEVPVLRDTDNTVSGSRMVSKDLTTRVRELERQVAFLDQDRVVSASAPVWLTALVILLTLLSLFNLYLNISTRYGPVAQKQKTDPSGNASGTSAEASAYQSLQQDYKKLNAKIEDLRRDVERLVKASVITNAPAAERGREKEQQAKPQNSFRQPRVNPSESQEDAQFNRNTGEGNYKGRNERNYRDKEGQNRDRTSDRSFSNPREGGNRNKVPQEAAVSKRVFYAEYPKEEGFVSSQLRDMPDRRSLYKISYKEGDSSASFTIVDDPSIHEYALQNRERLLKDACEFEISSSKHTRIEVIAPGQLRKNGLHWTIVHKAKIRFI